MSKHDGVILRAGLILVMYAAYIWNFMEWFLKIPLSHPNAQILQEFLHFWYSKSNPVQNSEFWKFP